MDADPPPPIDDSEDPPDDPVEPPSLPWALLAVLSGRPGLGLRQGKLGRRRLALSLALYLKWVAFDIV